MNFNKKTFNFYFFLIIILYFTLVKSEFELKYTFGLYNGSHSSPSFFLDGTTIYLPTKSIQVLVTASTEQINVWNLETGSLFNKYNFTEKIDSVIILEDGCLAVALKDYSIKIYEIGNNNLKYEFNSSNTNGHSDTINSLVQLQNSYLASGSSDGSIKIWDINLGRLKYTFFNDGFNYLVPLNDGYLASSSLFSPFIQIWDITNGKLSFQIDGSLNESHTKGISYLLSLNNGNLVSCSTDLTIKVWDLEEKRLKYTIETNDHLFGYFYKLELLDNGYLVSYSLNDQNIRVWDIENQNLKYVFNETNGGHTSIVKKIIPLSSGYFVSGSKDSTLKIWNSNLGLLNYTINYKNDGHSSAIRTLANLDDVHFVSSSEDLKIKIWYYNLV